MKRHRILFIDAYDSFSNNVVSLLTTLLNTDVEILPIDSDRFDQTSAGFRDELGAELRRYDAVVCGPGPGSPGVDTDVGLMKHIWELADEHLLPVLGICLGFQSLAVSCGAKITKIAHGGLHGMIRDIDYVAEDGVLPEGNIFSSVPKFKATLYHSLSADIGQSSIRETEWPALKWKSPYRMPDIVPLAWVEESRDGRTERILMAMKHRRKPFWGLQYHPESISSEITGHQVISNWFGEALQWARRHARVAESIPISFAPGCRRPSLLAQSVASRFRYGGGSIEGDPLGIVNNFNFEVNSQYTSKVVWLPPHIEAPNIVELLRTQRCDNIILDSASANANRIGLDVRGRYSIIALGVEDSLRFEYHVGNSYAVARMPSHLASEQCCPQKIHFEPRQTIWHLLAEFMNRRKMEAEGLDSPFVGGFMGYISYELGLECIDVNLSNLRGHQRPDLCFTWVTKSIVIDHMERTLRIQHLHPSASASEAGNWVNSIAEILETSVFWTDGLHLTASRHGTAENLTPPITPTGRSDSPDIQAPDARQYETKVRKCQDFIAAGDTYELCLTDQTSITRSRPKLQHASHTLYNNSWAPSSATQTPSSWQLYQSLRSRQPAPFGAYIRLGGATLISSSPERFLEYNADGLCSMRPMKGTVRKSEAVSTLEQAEKILHVPKEEAENLMIVDLVRHDLHSVCGSGNVTVPQLMKVEEYTSVFQMISVVEGRLPRPETGAEDTRYTGLDVLAASLPPGSMTGAPKKRSCDILQEIEGGKERGLYSGVVGYMDVAGRGDWSVTIRSLFRWDDETTRQDDGSETEMWHIGAGGAVTALSTAEGEREEMFVKLKGPLGVFEE